MEQRVSLITLGVGDVTRSCTFYTALGWRTDSDPDAGIVFFQAGGVVVALWGRVALAADSGVEDRGGWGGVTLAYNVGSPAEVDEVIEQARASGAAIPLRADRRSGVGTRRSSSIPTDTRGRSRTTRSGR
jgi:catechol 2,3-dioxygenase-like lactoylglutathione lyase family enzyme